MRIHRRGASRAHLMLPIAGVGLVIACVAALMFAPRETHPVSHVIRTVREIALAARAPDAPPEAGMLGPWKISAAGVDPESGRLVDFHVESGQMMISADSADVIVDPAADSFSIQMWNVVFVRVPDDDEAADAGVHRVDFHVLGPAPYGIDIVADGAESYRDARDSGEPGNRSPLTVAGEAMDGPDLR